MIRSGTYVRFCAWGGPAFLLALIFFWGLMGFNIPPYGSDLPAEAIAAHFREHAVTVRIGMILTVAFAVLYLVWGIAVAAVMEGIAPGERILPQLQIWGAGFTTLVISIPSCLWLAAAFRPGELPPSVTAMLYDLGWILFDVQNSMTMIQIIPMAVCFLKDGRRRSVVPKWMSWYMLWVGCMLPVLSLIALFKSGPFSRSGLINYWFEFPIFFLFMIVASVAIIRAIPRLESEAAPGTVQ